MAPLPRNCLTSVQLLLFVSTCCGCGGSEKTEQVGGIDPQPAPSVVQAGGECEWIIPGSTRAVPEWIDAHAEGAPFDARAWLEHWNEYTEAECLYLQGMYEFYRGIEKKGYTRPAEEQARSDGRHNVIIQWCPTDVPPDESVTLERALAAVAPMARAFELIDLAQQHPPCVFSPQLTQTQPIPHVMAARIVNRACALELRSVRPHGSFETVERAFRRMLGMARDCRPRGSLISQVVSISLEGFALESLQSDILTRPWLTPTECERLLAVLDAHVSASVDPMAEAVRAEYILLGNTIHSLETGAITLEEADFGEASQELMDSIDYEVEWRGLHEVGQKMLECVSNPYADFLKGDDYVAYLNEARDASKSGVRRGADKKAKLTKPFISIMLAPALVDGREAAARAQTRLGVMAAMLRIRRYQLLRQRVPETLAEAFGDAAVPIDPYSGEPLRYRVAPNWILIYSVGKDQHDDRAETGWDWGRQPGDFIFRLPPELPKAAK